MTGQGELLSARPESVEDAPPLTSTTRRSPCDPPSVGVPSGSPHEWHNRTVDDIAIELRLVPLDTSRDDGFRLGRALLRETAARLTSQPADEIVITAICPDCGGNHGKPTTSLGIFVSLSRCAGAIVAVASRVGPIGVDVEPVDGAAGREGAIRALTGHASVRHWTHVEAVLKADGRGLRVDPSLVSVRGDEATVADRPTRYRLSEPLVHASLVVSLATAIAD